MAKGREITLGRVKVCRNQKDGNYIEVQSKRIERFFALEMERSHQELSPELDDTTAAKVGYNRLYLLSSSSLSTIEGNSYCVLRSGDLLRDKAYIFLRAQGLGDGLKIPITQPLTNIEAQHLGESIGQTMQALYIAYLRNYSFDITVKANIEDVES
jgi:hypothetical protein